MPACIRQEPATGTWLTFENALCDAPINCGRYAGGGQSPQQLVNYSHRPMLYRRKMRPTKFLAEKWL